MSEFLGSRTQQHEPRFGDLSSEGVSDEGPSWGGNDWYPPDDTRCGRGNLPNFHESQADVADENIDTVDNEEWNQWDNNSFWTSLVGTPYVVAVTPEHALQPTDIDKRESVNDAISYDSCGDKDNQKLIVSKKALCQSQIHQSNSQTLDISVYCLHLHTVST